MRNKVHLSLYYANKIYREAPFSQKFEIGITVTVKGKNCIAQLKNSLWKIGTDFRTNWKKSCLDTTPWNKKKIGLCRDSFHDFITVITHFQTATRKHYNRIIGVVETVSSSSWPWQCMAMFAWACNKIYTQIALLICPQHRTEHHI